MKTWQYLLAMTKRSPKSSGVYDADAPQPVRSKNRNDSRKRGLSRSWSGLAGCPPLLLRRSGSCSLRRPKGDLWSGHAPGDGRAGRSLDMVECFLITGPFHGMPLIKKFAKRSIRDLVVAAFAFQQIASSICFYVVSSAFVLARELHLQADNLPPVLLEGPTQKSGRPCAGTRLVCLHVVSNAFWQYLCPRHEQLQS